MKELTNEQFKSQVDRWQLHIAQASITLPNGDPVPDKIFHLFLGVGYSTFKKMMSCKNSARKIQPYTANTIAFVNKLSTEVFLDEIRKIIPEFIQAEKQ